MHSWRRNVELLEMVDRPKTLGFQADMAHTMLFTLGYNAPEDRLLPEDFDWSSSDGWRDAYRKMARALRPWTIDFHVAQNDGTVKGSGSHDKTGRHCLPHDPNGKLDIVRDAGAWMRDDNGKPTRAFEHICWDGCMFPNAVMLDQQTWNDILRVDDRGAQRARLGLNRTMKKKLNIGMVGYGFMGRTHSNAFRQAPQFLRSAVPARC